MKKLFFLLIMFPIVCVGQINLNPNFPFNVTRNVYEERGFKYSDFRFDRLGQFYSKSSNNSYRVIDIEGKTKNELYKIVLTGVHKIYLNPQKVLHCIENEMIKVSAYQSSVFSKPVKVSGYDAKRYFGLEYNITFEFKDGKIRINVPSTRVVPRDGTTSSLGVYIDVWEMFNGNEVKLEYKEISKDINDFINETINDIVKKGLEDSEW